MSEAFVLRDVDVEAAVYSLPRPNAVLPAVAAPAATPAVVIPTLEEQLGQSYREGVQAGRALQAENALLERQAAADEELKQALASAAKDGYAQGRAKALEEARQAAEEAKLQFEQRVAALQSLAASVAGQADAALEGVEDELVGLCHDVLCRLLGEAAASPEGIRALVKQALRELPGEPLSIHLHPDDLALLTASDDGIDSRIRWRPDSSVVLGGAILKGEGGSIDARLETQLRALSEKLTAVRAAHRAQRAVQP